MKTTQNQSLRPHTEDVIPVMFITTDGMWATKQHHLETKRDNIKLREHSFSTRLKERPKISSKILMVNIEQPTELKLQIISNQWKLPSKLMIKFGRKKKRMRNCGEIFCRKLKIRCQERQSRNYALLFISRYKISSTVKLNYLTQKQHSSQIAQNQWDQSQRPRRKQRSEFLRHAKRHWKRKRERKCKRKRSLIVMRLDQ